MFVKEAKATAKHILTATEEESKKVLEEIESGVKTFEDAAKNILHAHLKHRAEASEHLAVDRW